VVPARSRALAPGSARNFSTTVRSAPRQCGAFDHKGVEGIKRFYRERGSPFSVARSGRQGWRVSATEGLCLTVGSTTEHLGHHGTKGSEFRQHAGQDFVPEVFFIAQAVDAPLDHPDFRVQPQRDFLSGLQYAAMPSQCRSIMSTNLS
jgi:hypothetical protein